MNDGLILESPTEQQVTCSVRAKMCFCGHFYAVDSVNLLQRECHLNQMSYTSSHIPMQ